MKYNYTLVKHYSIYTGHCETTGFYDEGYNEEYHGTYNEAKKAMRLAIDENIYTEVFILDINNKQVSYYG